MADEKQAKIGVFLCDCGETLDRLVDFAVLKEHAKDLPNVQHVELDKFLCSKESRHHISTIAKEKGLDRIVIGACSPRIYIDEFRDAAEHGGINRYMVEMANIREQDAWVHSKGVKAQATEKAKDLVSMSVRRSMKMIPSSHGPAAAVMQEICSACGICASTCRMGAITIVEEKGKRKPAVVDASECRGCGACVAACPAGAMNMEGFSNEEIIAEIDEITKGLLDSQKPTPTVLVFACNWCTYAAADLAGLKRLQMDTRFRIIRTPCSARVDPEWVLKAFSQGIDGVMVLGGREGSCHYEGGNVRTRNRMAILTQLLEQLGFSPDRFAVDWVNSDEPHRFAELVNNFIVKINELEANPVRAQSSEERMTSALYHPDLDLIQK